jgi:hypothetical protein
VSNVLGLGVGVGGEDVADVLPVDEVARHMDGEELARSVPDNKLINKNKKWNKTKTKTDKNRINCLKKYIGACTWW